MLLVNFTTFRENSVDHACILTPEDYSELSHTTTVAYSRAMIGVKSAFIKALVESYFMRLNDLSPAAMQRIIAGAHKSDELSAIKKRVLPSLRSS